MGATWAELEARGDEAHFRVFGEDVVYQDRPSAPLTVRGIREQNTALDRPDALGAFALVTVRMGDIPGGPQKGAVVTLEGSVEYVVTDIRPTDAGSTRRTLVMSRRAGQVA